MAETLTATGIGGGARSRIIQRVIVVLYVGVLVLVPLVVVSWKTFEGGLSAFWSALSSSDSVTAMKLTAEVSISAVLINVIFGVGLSLLLTRYRFFGRRLLGAFADLPISVSPIVVGLALLLVYGPVSGWFGPSLKSAGISLMFNVPAMVLATAFVSLPLILREIIPVLEEEGTDQEQAARVLGANAFQQFRRITLPVIRPALGYGIVLALARSIGEYGAVRVVGGNFSGQNSTQTLPLLIGDRYEQGVGGYYPLAFLLIVVTVVAIVIASLRGHQEPS